MTAEIHQLEITPGSGRLATPQLRTLVVCDIADSTALVERMGDQNAANIIRKHDRLARALIEQHRGREIDKTDGFLLMFDRPIQAAAFALDYQRGLKHLSAAEGVVVRARVGIHVGDVVVWENAPEDVARGAKPVEVEGLVKPIAARLAQLAQPQQILMSSAAAGIAHRAVGELGSDAAQRMHWKEHGRYRFKGLPEPIGVTEVGDAEFAPLHAPRSVRNAKRVLPWWRRPLTLAAEAMVLAIGLATGAWIALQSPPTLAFGARDWVVVGSLDNLTDDKLFNRSVDTALRISLEQSKYVNVLPELSVRQTLQRMELNPDNTDVNRAVGSQVALRDGARALIVPTIADIGGRVRVTAEVIDPNTRTTVYTVSADGVGKQSVLPSLDRVSKQLRGKLGEALARVSKTSEPMAKVATSNLNALRAYSLAEQAYAKGDMRDVVAYQTQALQIDPNFTLARIALVRAYVSEGDDAKAAGELKLAAVRPERLAPREKLYLSAWQSTFAAPDSSLAKWKLLATIYPDFYAGVGSYSFFNWQIANDFPRAIAATRSALTPQNPHQSVGRFFLGNLYLGQGDYAKSIAAYDAALKGGIGRTEYLATVYAAKRDFNAAHTWLQKAVPSTLTAGDLDLYVKEIAINVDQGRWDAAYTALAEAKQKAGARDFQNGKRFSLIGLSLQSVTATPDKLRVILAAYLATIPHRARAESPAGLGGDRFRLAFAAYLAARRGFPKLATQALSGIKARDGGLPATANMLTVARAQLAIDAKNPAAAIRLLTPLVNGTELFVTHLALMDAYRAEGNAKAAESEAMWLASHRGRAYAEYSVQWITSAFNVAQTDLALLDLAEFAARTGDTGIAKSRLAAFRQAWPDAERLPWLTPRLKAIGAGR